VRVVQIAQHADDLDRAAAWYERFLGVPAAARFEPPGLLFFVVDGVRLLIEKAAPSATVYFEVDDVRARLDELRADGVHVVAEPHVIFTHEDDTLGPAGTAEWMAFVEDSEGNPVGLVSRSAP
jgi:methylmalonyl-CoA/ethylmalonyl-CoA epimerase